MPRKVQGSAAKDEPKEKEITQSVRVTQGMIDDIEEILARRQPIRQLRPSRQQWLFEAVLEKIERERNRDGSIRPAAAATTTTGN